MNSNSSATAHGPSVKAFILLGTALAVAGWAGCSSPPTRTRSAAGTGAMIGTAGGLLAASGGGMNPLAGAVGGAALGGIIGATVGAIQQHAENKEQAEIAQERAFFADRAAKQKEEALERARLEQEVQISQGFQITDAELEAQQRRAAALQAEAKRLEGEMAAAKAKFDALAQAKNAALKAEAEIAQYKENIARLKGDTEPASPASVPASPATTPSAK